MHGVVPFMLPLARRLDVQDVPKLEYQRDELSCTAPLRSVTMVGVIRQSIAR